jgi:hypothetical protein
VTIREVGDWANTDWPPQVDENLVAKSKINKKYIQKVKE